MTQVSNDTIAALCAQLSLEDKVKLLTGQDDWSTWPLPDIGLRSIVVSDGPSGVRGEVWDERSPSLNLPSASALSSSWDDGLAYEYATVAAAEARRKGVDVVLGPTINLHRSPLGGRHFEAYSEDPFLTGRLAAAYVRGLQDHGVAATPKHYVGNDSETDRFTVDVIVDDRTLREVYLAAFEPAVVEAQTWMIMSSYNSVNGNTMSENELLADPLRSEWGFDGVMVSDWGAVRTTRAANFEQDLAMPGPRGAWGDALVAAVRSGEVEEAAIDRKVQRILLLAARVGALTDVPGPASAPPSVDGPGFIRRAAVEGCVLVKNDDLLPVASPSSIAVIGPSAAQARTQGGGSATVLPTHTVSPLEGLRASFQDAEISYAPGVVHEGLAALPLDQLSLIDSGAPGAHVRFLDDEGNVLLEEERLTADGLIFPSHGRPRNTATVEFSTRWTPPTSGPVELGCSVVGTVRLLVDGELLAEAVNETADDDPAAAIFNPPAMSTEVSVVEGQPLDLVLQVTIPRGPLSLTVGFRPSIDADVLIAEAVEAARHADLAVVVVGTTAQVESEGFDRQSLALPGRQDELVSAICAANPRTVVVVNSGAPVLTPWRDEAAAILVSWFGGQEYGHALADIIGGTSEPGGRLPTTWPATEQSVPILDTTPTDGRLVYDEGLDIGYRAWLRSDKEPAFWFGAGLGYTTWEVGEPTVGVQENGDVTVTTALRNTGDRAGKHVVQIYASRPDSTIDRPERWLVGYGVARAEAGEEASVEVTVGRRAFAHWTDNGWEIEPGPFMIHVGTSANDLLTAVPVSPTQAV